MQRKRGKKGIGSRKKRKAAENRSLTVSLQGLGQLADSSLSLSDNKREEIH